MGRMLPVECRHGVIVDWGDFGPHQNGCPASCIDSDCPDTPGCEVCEEEDGRWWWVRQRQAILRCVTATGFAASNLTSICLALLLGAWWTAPLLVLPVWLAYKARADYRRAVTPPALFRLTNTRDDAS